MGLVRLFVYDPYGSMGCREPGGCYNTGLMDTDARPGAQCLNPDPQMFTSDQDMIDYAESRGETLQVTDRTSVNFQCSASALPAIASPFCGGGPRTTPPEPIPNQMPGVNPLNTARAIIDRTRRMPINTIIY